MAVGFLQSLKERFGGRPVDWEDLEETLIRADLGMPFVLHLLNVLREKGSGVTAATVEEVLRGELITLFPIAPPGLLPVAGRPKTILLLGVNGTGKTTTAAKLGFWLKTRRRNVLFAAADTFRAAAIEQLCTWGERLEIEVIRGQYQGDPAALCFDAWSAASRRNADFLICDTAGRLHNKSNLMQEISKVGRTLAKHHPDAPEEKWLVIDATTGMNALVQAREFHASVGLTGVILTKLDGSGKGGIAAAIQHEIGLSPRFIGTGERPEDFALFDRSSYVKSLLGLA